MTEAPDTTFLFTKVVLVFGLNGACRADELRTLTVDDIKDTGSILIVTLNDTKTKRKRIFTVTSEDSPINGVQLYRKYLNLRPPNVPHRRLFVCYRNGKCTVQAVGINTFYNVSKKIAEYLKLPDAAEYTGHCMRRTSATFLANNGASIETLKRHGGWRSSTIAESYVEESIANKVKTSNQIFQVQNTLAISNAANEVPSVSNVEESIAKKVKTSNQIFQVQNTFAVSNAANEVPRVNNVEIPSCSGITFSNLHNCTINFIGKK